MAVERTGIESSNLIYITDVNIEERAIVF